jgi:hypothetical protein
MPDVDAFAYYLPQFYPIEINSRWWGEGYTEWNALVGAQRGVRSPQEAMVTPGELGFYDLRLTDTRSRQGELARAAGLAAFCIYHYCSRGHRVLPHVVDAMLRDGQPDFPFFLCWANHDWTLAWKGQPDVVTWTQEYDEDHDDAHINWMLDVFADPRYYRIGNAPVLAVYDIEKLPSTAVTLNRWRTLAQRRGFSGLVILAVGHTATPPSPTTVGIDAWIQGAGPALGLVSQATRVRSALLRPARLWRFLRYGDYFVSHQMLSKLLVQARAAMSDQLVPMVMSSFNNIGRRNRRAFYLPSDPVMFRRAVETAAAAAPLVTSPDGARRLIAINAWNEWGEGMTIEPSVEFGDSMLRALAAGLGGTYGEILAQPDTQLAEG